MPEAGAGNGVYSTKCLHARNTKNKFYEKQNILVVSYVLRIKSLVFMYTQSKINLKICELIELILKNVCIQILQTLHARAYLI